MAPVDGLSGPLRPGDGRSDSSGSGASGRGPGGGPQRRRAPRRLRLLFAGFLLLLLLEIIVLITVGQAIGPWPTLGLLLLFVVAGLYLVRRESGRTWTALRRAVDTGRMPGRELADASLVLLGGLFLLIPGFVSDLIGIFLILPFTRTFSRRLLAVFIGSRMPVVVSDPWGGAGSAGFGPGATSGPGPGFGPGAGHGGRRGEDEVIEGEIISEDPPWQHREDPPT